jgi:hypothetical protein
VIDERLIQAAEHAVAELELAKSDSERARLELRCASMGLSILAEIGARMLTTVDTDYVCVRLGGDVIQGRRMLAGHEDLLRRLGWVEHPADHSWEPLAMVHTR